jgi:hypothetical protein
LRQCHALILKTRAERAERERARAVGEVKLPRQRRRVAAASRAGASFLAMMRHEVRTPMSAVLGLAATLLVTPLEAQQRTSVEAISDAGDNLRYLLDDTLDFSKLETGRLALEPRAFSPEGLVDQTAGIAASWADQQAIGLWIGEFNGHVDNSKADILWQNADVTSAAWSMDGFNMPSGDNVGFSPGPAWQVHGASDFSGDAKTDTDWQNSDDAPALWPMDGFDLVSDTDAGFDPGTGWHEIQQYHDLFL